ncbi:hypothetical protein MIND_00184100 [Mycena indigotica]|uniref:Uncharacterized protein n=1 Tax=Mycena indigotica TaxID=2126181 RepID=A0A8H6T9C3_9AGAR|nr:uncharacterized protein MIND_00184100 [Mycena indigotica]KAF7311740.1 hypothetical protein MIND_00184100 [Mycena indigotica]
MKGSPQRRRAEKGACLLSKHDLLAPKEVSLLSQSFVQHCGGNAPAPPVSSVTSHPPVVAAASGPCSALTAAPTAAPEWAPLPASFFDSGALNMAAFMHFQSAQNPQPTPPPAIPTPSTLPSLLVVPSMPSLSPQTVVIGDDVGGRGRRWGRSRKFVSPEAKEFLRHLVDDEIPKALRKYVTTTLFPRIGVKAGLRHSISLSTARKWMAKFGWKYQEHKKALYYDGHERPDIVDYRQKEFIPAMLRHKPRLVEYVVGDIHCLVDKGTARWTPERALVLCAHDEVTTQAHDGKAKSWGPVGEQPLRKKSKGRGMHYSGIIVSTCGDLREAGQTMEYGKNYDGYWNGEMFVNQLKEKIIPAFEKEHGPGYQALFMIDNSQGHSAYSVDALLAQRMNLNWGSKQARLHSGCKSSRPSASKPAQGHACCSAGTGAVALRLASRVQNTLRII